MNQARSRAERERCDLCGGIKMGPIYWRNEALAGEKICRRGRVVFSGDKVDGEYDCDGTRVPDITFTSGDTPKEPER